MYIYLKDWVLICSLNFVSAYKFCWKFSFQVYSYEQPKISISISLSGNVVITIHVLPVCSGRPDLDLWNGTPARKSTSQSVYRCGKECLQFHHYIFHLRGRLEFWACSNGLRHTWCTVLYLHDGKLLLGAGAFLSLFKQCEARMVCTICFRACRKMRSIAFSRK